MALCYLDGRIIDFALKDEGLYDIYAKKPMYVTFTQNSVDQVLQPQTYMEYSTMKQDDINIIRVVLQSPYIRHSTVLFLNLMDGKNEAHWFNPRTKNNLSNKLHDQIKTIIHNYLKTFIKNIKLVDIDSDITEVTNKKCFKSGLCNAYVLKYILDWNEDKEFDPSDIEGFAMEQHNKYKDRLTEGDPDIEYQFNTEGATIGGLGGLVVGGLLGGPVGAVAGAAAGGALGGFGREYLEKDYDGKGKNQREMAEKGWRNNHNTSSRSYNVRDYSHTDSK